MLIVGLLAISCGPLLWVIVGIIIMLASVVTYMAIFRGKRLQPCQ